MAHRTRLTDKYDVPRMVLTALVWGVMILVVGMGLRAGWELMGRMVG